MCTLDSVRENKIYSIKFLNKRNEITIEFDSLRSRILFEANTVIHYMIKQSAI